MDLKMMLWFQEGLAEIVPWRASCFVVFAVLIRVIKWRRMRWAGHVARIEERRRLYVVLVEKPEGKRLLEGQGVDVRIILKWILKK
jgi:hypothetical protein